MDIVRFTFSNFIGFGQHASVNLRIRVKSPFWQDVILSKEVCIIPIQDDETPYSFADRILTVALGVLRDLSVTAADSGFPDIARQLDVSIRNNRQIWAELDRARALCAFILWAHGLNSMEFQALHEQVSSPE